MDNYNQQISRSFHLRLRILLSFQSPYFFTIELQTYLKLALDLAVFPLHTRGTVLFSWIGFLIFLYRAITVYGTPFQGTSSQRAKPYQAPHLNCISAAIRFALFRFYSPLLTESQLFSFISAYLDASIQRVPNPFGPLAEASTKSHSKIPGSKATYAYPGLIAVCCVLHRSLESSYPSVGILLKPFLCSNITLSLCFCWPHMISDHDSCYRPFLILASKGVQIYSSSSTLTPRSISWCAS